jgi:prepilin-type N-terminal cleavage/methylation domain-containing protein
MTSNENAEGFSLIELLLVLAIIGIISGIAIPAYLGQRRRARVIGDAMSNAKVIAMMLETRKADNGVYGTDGAYNWVSGSAQGSAATLLPAFTPKGNSIMDFTVQIASTGLAYTITVVDPTLGRTAYQTDQTGSQLQRLQ